jgi:ABC-2 type transport system permease protein
MNGLVQQFVASLRLHFRNRMALLYGYLFPTIFLVAFWVLYRHERVPLVRHMGELLTVTILGGACFGLPSTMVSERERGVWRRYRLLPAHAGSLVTSTVLARYVLLITAALLQIGLAMAIGMPMPRHPFDLWVAFTFAAFAFLGLGLVIAMMADNVPAVQALGQCLFLPMLIIGGVAVPLMSLPEWAQHLSAYFPGRYSVDAVQTAVHGSGLTGAGFTLAALFVIGLSGCVAGAKMFRWDSGQRFASRAGKGWLAVALASWVAVGLAAGQRGRIVPAVPDQTEAANVPAPAPPVATRDSPAPPLAVPQVAEAPKTTAPPVATAAAPPSVAPPPEKPAPPATVPLPPATTPAQGISPKPPEPQPRTGPASWRDVTMADIDRDLIFTRLPSDGGVVTPIAGDDEDPDPDVLDQLEVVRQKLPTWAPAKVADPVQRVRNYLYVAAVPDIFQVPIERFLPVVVFTEIQQNVPKDELVKILYWIAMHPMEGDDKAVDQLHPLGLGNGPGDQDQLRERAAIYAVKLLGRMTGKRPAR